MRWMKHMTATWDDEKVADLVGKGGMEGLARYGLLWRVREIVAGQIGAQDSAASVQYTVTRWSTLLSLRGSLVFSTLSTLGVTGLATVERDGARIRVTIPNLLKYRDEYSRKSGHRPDNVTPRTDLEGDTDIEGDTDTKPLARTRSKKPARVVPENERAGTLPLNDGTEYHISKAQINEWRELYPAVAVQQQCRNMKGWLMANPTKRKTSRGIVNFITNWLKREQDRAGSSGSQTNPGASAVPAGAAR